VEDLFNVKAMAPGLDGKGHLGYSAQPGLAPFGSDVFTNPMGYPVAHAWGHHEWLALFPLTGLGAGGAVPARLRRRRRTPTSK
jgi:hypothetical protein